MHPILIFLILFYLVAFVYDKTIDKEINNNKILATKLIDFKFFNSFQSRPKALYSALSFQFFGVSISLNIIGSVFSLMMYFGLISGIYFLAQ
ncbi:MAG TPA: hypothetical protein DE042_06920 [Colwellia sp.]|nr:hypothetical protein [Colwellia sp.]